MEHLCAVMDAAGSRRAALFGISEGGPLSMLFAATVDGESDRKPTAASVAGRKSRAPLGQDR